MTKVFPAGSGGNKKKKKTKRPAPVVHQTIIQQAPSAPPPRAPVRTPDSLASKQYATFLDLISEGEIEGFPSARSYKDAPVDSNGDPIAESAAQEAERVAKYNTAMLKDIYLNDSPILQDGADVESLQASDYNYSGFEIDWRAGSQDQAVFDDFGDIESDISVDSTVPVRKNEPKTRRIYDDDVDTVRVSLSFPRLQMFTTYGDIYATSVDVKILRKYANETEYTTVIEDKYEGRTADLYVRDYLIKLDGAFPVDIRVERVTDDATDENTQDEFFWTVITHIVNQRLRYPNSALVATRVDASEFGAVPNRSFKIRGIKVPIPTGTTVDQDNGRIIYPENFIWDGTFQVPQWTTCPSMLLLELLTNRTFGFGDHIQLAQLDRWSFFEASKYCCELINKGDGSTETEPRFSCNGVLRNADSAYKLINDLSSVFRCMAYWSTGSIQISQDRPRDSTFLFNSDNVLQEGFLYRNASQKTRHTVVTVSYFNMDLRQVDYVVAEDQDGVRKWGVIQTEIKAFCCTSRTQARRLARWLLYTESAESEICEFKTSIGPGTVVRPGSIITIADQTKTGQVSSGRVLMIARGEDQGTIMNSLPVSALVSISGDIPQDATFDKFTYVTRGGMVRSRPVRGVMCPPMTFPHAEANRAATVVVDIQDLESEEWPVVGVPYALEEAGGVTEGSKWRVLSVIEEDDGVYGITAMAHDSSKYAHIEASEPLQERVVFTMSPEPESPSGLTLVEKFYIGNENRVKTKICASWEAVEGAQRYRVMYRQEGANWDLTEVASPSCEITEIAVGEIYEIRVFAVSSGLFQSANYASATITTYGKTEPPLDVEKLSAAVVVTDRVTEDSDATAIRIVELSWDESIDLDVINGGHVRIHKATSAANVWEESVLVATANGAATTIQIPASADAQTYLVCFEDDGGRVSANPAVATIETLARMDERLLTVAEFDLPNGTKKLFPGHPTLEVVDTPLARKWSGKYWRLGVDPSKAPSGGLMIVGQAKIFDTNGTMDSNGNIDLMGASPKTGLFTSDLTFEPTAGTWDFAFEQTVTTGQHGAIEVDNIDPELAIDNWMYFDSKDTQKSRIETGLHKLDSLVSIGFQGITGAQRSGITTLVSGHTYYLWLEIDSYDTLQGRIDRQLAQRGYPTLLQLIRKDGVGSSRTTVNECTIKLKLARRETGVVVVQTPGLTAGATQWLDFSYGFYIPPTVILLDSSTVTLTSVERGRFMVTASSATAEIRYVASGYGKNKA